MKINVVYNDDIKGFEKVLSEVENTLSMNKVDFESFELLSMKNYGDFTIAIGGDGTLLNAARFYSANAIPVFGINIGRLGFLSQSTSEGIRELIKKVITGEYVLEERLMLQSDNELALNDFVIKGCNPARTSKFYLEINGRCVCDYIADGLIISTPTGSTAYGLSAGGPVIYPTLNAITIVPICPHTLNARPLVVPVGEVISVKTPDGFLSVSPDGLEAVQVQDICIKASDKKAILAFIQKEGFYTVLRNKLHWGISPQANRC